MKLAVYNKRNIFQLVKFKKGLFKSWGMLKSMISESGTTQSTIKKLPRTKSHKVEFVWHV